MKLAVFSDIHGNMHFFEAFLRDAEAEGVDRLIFLGDAVSYYPFGCAVIRSLWKLGALCIEGNHDSMLRGEFPIPQNHEPVYQLRKTIAEISAEELAFVKSWPEIVHETLDGKRLTFVHGSPLNHLKGYSYVALLPKKGLPLKKYVASLTGTKFRKLVSGATRANVIVSLPKQSLTYSNDAMEKQLSAMGMKTAFSPKRADFSKMASDATGRLHIGQVVHKTRVDVDEEGTKAAAVTGVFMKSSAIRLGDVKRVILNRPFVYAIVDNATKLPVFIGTVNNLR